MFGEENDFKFQMDLDSANHMDVTPEVSVADTSNDGSLYDSRHGFSDVDLLSSLKGFTEEMPVATYTQDSVTEFVAQSDNLIQFNSQGDPQVLQQASVEKVESFESLPTSLETAPAETLAMFDQEDNR